MSEAVYPAEWSILKHPGQRRALINILKELADRNIQRELWISNDLVAGSAYGIDEVFHFLFDDTNFGVNPDAEVGYIVFDAKESRLVGDLCVILDGIFQRIGDKSSAEYMMDKEWPAVVAAAHLAYQELAMRGDMDE